MSVYSSGKKSWVQNLKDMIMCQSWRQCPPLKNRFLPYPKILLYQLIIYKLKLNKKNKSDLDPKSQCSQQIRKEGKSKLRGTKHTIYKVLPRGQSHHHVVPTSMLSRKDSKKINTGDTKICLFEVQNHHRESNITIKEAPCGSMIKLKLGFFQPLFSI